MVILKLALSILFISQICLFLDLKCEATELYLIEIYLPLATK